MNDTVYTRYPFWSVFTDNVVTVIHFLVGGAGFILGYNYWLGWLLGPLISPVRILRNVPDHAFESLPQLRLLQAG